MANKKDIHGTGEQHRGQGKEKDDSPAVAPHETKATGKSAAGKAGKAEQAEPVIDRPHGRLRKNV